MSRFRILSLDGGGIRGAFTSSVLATLEQATGRSCVDHFDLITGTSTGGIIALGLALGRPAAEVRDFYRNKGPDIFQ
ncbi:patatin-like phospholipase family protein [Hyalangium sp.]|uniref:patatin-like phospholipase family protein n=1 Tax=Hyalangium sp. TaxID=2028555 RepID=UPI002D2BC37D|nr:patatin-like phospholipase family protein [Hyalangium sp.]HYH98957.1 patatin-like phospholipase family protein [Hyalangium sp.]